MPADSLACDDPDFARIRAWFDNSDRLERIGESIRLALDWVIDGPRTGRYSIDQLQTSEKIYIGNRVEHEILHELDLPKVPPLDTMIDGIAVDLKFSIDRSWMIPPEAIGEVCLILSANDLGSVFNVGLLRVQQKWLGRAEGNRDKKMGITAAGRKAIDWIRRDHPLPRNFLLHLDPGVRTSILTMPDGRPRSGQQRINQVFRLMVGYPISTNAIDTLAVQRDPSKRCRDARIPLRKEGIIVCSAKYDYAKVKKYGYPPLKRDHWMSIRIGDRVTDSPQSGE